MTDNGLIYFAKKAETPYTEKTEKDRAEKVAIEAPEKAAEGSSAPKAVGESPVSKAAEKAEGENFASKAADGSNAAAADSNSSDAEAVGPGGSNAGEAGSDSSNAAAADSNSSDAEAVGPGGSNAAAGSGGSTPELSPDTSASGTSGGEYTVPPESRVCMRPDQANRHGFICGATGTGKSVTLKVLAESFSKIGVPVFMSDVKGDMSGIAVPGEDSENMQERIDRFGIRNTFEYHGFPVSIFDIYAEKGTPLRTTVSEMGPQLFSQVLDLNDTQTELMQVIFKIADDNGLLLIDTKDMKAMLQYAADNSADFKMDYGLIPQQTASAIIRAIVALEAEGADKFFGEPAIDIRDFFLTAPDGRGIINILDAETLINRPRLYSAFMLYLLSELFELLPEVGNPEKPKIVFFFDEAHLLFKNASKILLEKIEQVVKLIRSKGVSVFFVTQSPGDIPGAVMSQLGNKIEHGLQAYTPSEQRALRAAADAFRVNPEFDTEELLQNLGTGEAVVSLLDEKGVPGMAEHVYILPPESRIGAPSDEERQKAVDNSPLNSKYLTMVDNISAYEIITGRVPGGETMPSSADTVTAPDGQVYGNTSGIPAAEKIASAVAISTEVQKSVVSAGQMAMQASSDSDKDIEITFEIEKDAAADLAAGAEAAATPAKTTEKVQKSSSSSSKKKTSSGSAKTSSSSNDGSSSAGTGSNIGELADSLLGRSGTRQVVRSTGSTIGREIGKSIGEAVLGKKGRTIGGNIGSAIVRNLFGTMISKK